LIYVSSGGPLKADSGIEMRTRLTENLPTVQVQIVTYNSALQVKTCLDAVLRQSYSNLHILVIDNYSSDASVELAEACGEGVQTIKLPTNVGYAAGHNIGFQMAADRNVKYVLTLNPDVELHQDYVGCVIAEMELVPQCAGGTGKLLRTSSPEELPVIDSTGLQMKRFLHVRDRGAGECDHGLYSQVEKVWGVCGAAAIYRIEMLKDVQQNGQVFDEAFFLYKEDVDLAWRANRRSWSFLYVPAATATHKRSWIKGARMPDTVTAHSFANQIALIIRHGPRFSWSTVSSIAVEMGRLVALSIRRPTVAWLATRLVFKHWRHHWNTRLVLRQCDLLKVSAPNDFYDNCHI
jgi:GT2 family glycosyltransferase